MSIVMANLLDLDVNYFAGQNNFSDVPEWASGYVNAYAANGIVTGAGGGRFGTGNVTATQAALMMLNALGYFQYNSDFGSDWTRATASQAAKINLFDDLDVRDNTLHITTGADAGGLDITGSNVKYVVRSSSNTKVSQAINRDEKNSSVVTSLQSDTVELGEHLFQGDLCKADAIGTADDFGCPGVKWTY